jgi:hypothetical protein
LRLGKSCKEALGFSGRLEREGMDRNIATERACPADFWRVGEEPSTSSLSESKAAFSVSRGEALILVLLLSFGLWAAIWGGVALLAVGGGRW